MTDVPEPPALDVEQLRDLVHTCRREVHLSRAAMIARHRVLDDARRRVPPAEYAVLRVNLMTAQYAHDRWNAEMAWALDLAAQHDLYA